MSEPAGRYESRNPLEWWASGLKDAASKAARFPDLMPVIHWLEAGGDPLEAAKELRIYQALLRSNQKNSSSPY